MIGFLPLLVLGFSSILSNLPVEYDEKGQLSSSRSYDLPCGVSLTVAPGNDRIIGGRLALDGEFPWQVSIQRFSALEPDFIHMCGGSIISDQWILTAAHCMFGVPVSGFRIIANITSLSEASDYHMIHNVSQIILHPEYDLDHNLNDIALVKLAAPLDFKKANGHMGTVCLPRASTASLYFNEPEAVNFVTVTGWGATEETENEDSINLLAADVTLVETNKCNSTYHGKIAKGFICAGLIEGGKDSCQGDSGGPMIYRDSNNQASLIGITSWGEGCGRKGIPGVYGDVSQYVDWIHQVIHDN